MKRETVEIQKEMFAPDASKLEKYCSLVVGRRGLGRLCLYELVQFASGTPGALGLLLRSRLYPLLLGACGRNVTFGRNVTLRHPHKIFLGDNVVIDDGVLLDAKGRDNDGIRIGSGVFIGRNTILSCKNGDIHLADGVNLGFNAEIFSASTVRLAENVLVAAYCYFIGGGHDYDDPTKTVLEQGRSSHGIEIGTGAWFGAGARILDGVHVGAHAIVGANAVVNRPVPAYAIAAGVPARILRDRREATPETDTPGAQS